MHLSGRISRVERVRIESGGNWDQLGRFLSAGRFLNGKVFILTDQNTRKHCLPVLLSHLPVLGKAGILEIQAGEENKTLKQAESLWQQLFEGLADRKTLLINLGGGVVTDLGGFVAAGFMRGIPYINLPASLMGMADAAIGGKTAVNFQDFKNQIGFFYPPAAIFIFPDFLSSLPLEHLRSGFAEIFKTALVGDPFMYRMILKLSVQQWMEIPAGDRRWTDLIQKTISLKNQVVRKDFLDKNQRKILNFGHSFGHAFETFSLQRHGTPVLHGEAVAKGMICESCLSFMKTGLPGSDLKIIVSWIREGFGQNDFQPEDFSKLLGYMQHDKKNEEGGIRFTLLEKPGKAKINVVCTRDEMLQAYHCYLNQEV